MGIAHLSLSEMDQTKIAWSIYTSLVCRKENMLLSEQLFISILHQCLHTFDVQNGVSCYWTRNSQVGSIQRFKPECVLQYFFTRTYLCLCKVFSSLNSPWWRPRRIRACYFIATQPMGSTGEAFHDRSTTGWHHRIFYFDEILYTGLSGAMKLILTFPEPWGQRFQSYSLGHFREVTLQDNLWRPIAPKSMHRIHQICISTWSQWVKEHFCYLRLKKWIFWWRHIFFCYLPIPLTPKKFWLFDCILKFDNLSWAEKKIGGVFFRKIL